MSDRVQNIARDILQSERAQDTLRNIFSGAFLKKRKPVKEISYDKFTVFIPGNSVKTSTGTTLSVRLPLDEDGKAVTSSLPIGAVVYPPFVPNRPASQVQYYSKVQYSSYFEDTVRKDHKLPELFSQCQQVYDAVGRIGERQNGVPTGNEKAYGTGVLVSNRHILTNHHVYSQMQYNPVSGVGIEFGAEKDTDFTDFVEISNRPAIEIPKYDAVLLTLAEPVLGRAPVKMIKKKVNSLQERDIMVIGYPMTRSDMRPRLILATKRYAQGKIFRHSTDQSKYLTVSVGAHPSVGEDVYMEALCHNASTLPGNSGSAVVDQTTGELIALHFGSDYAYRDGESANFAIPGKKIASKIKKAIKRNS